MSLVAGYDAHSRVEWVNGMERAGACDLDLGVFRIGVDGWIEQRISHGRWPCLVGGKRQKKVALFEGRNLTLVIMKVCEFNL